MDQVRMSHNLAPAASSNSLCPCLADLLRATRKGANCQRQDAGAGCLTVTMTHASSARTPPDTLHAEPTDVESGVPCILCTAPVPSCCERY